jgi:rod shape-determining protein MreC
MHYWMPGAALALALVLLNLPPTAADRLKLAVSTLFLPLFGLNRSIQAVADDASYGLLTRSTLIREVERLQRENQQLKLAAAQTADALAENTRLRAILGWQGRSTWKGRAARVIGREPTTWWRSVLIDFGSLQGAQVNQTVMTPDGLVGRIRSVQPTFSQVALIGDPECGVSVVINETREPGTILEARSATLGDGMVTLRTLQHSVTAMAGQSVTTLGNGGVFPKGIPVGQIIDTRSVDGGLSTEARLKLGAQLNRLEEVWVLTP